MQNIVVIWDQLGQEPLRFFVTQNQRFLDMDRMYINTYNSARSCTTTTATVSRRC